MIQDALSSIIREICKVRLMNLKLKSKIRPGRSESSLSKFVNYRVKMHRDKQKKAKPVSTFMMKARTVKVMVITMHNSVQILFSNERFTYLKDLLARLCLLRLCISLLNLVHRCPILIRWS